MAVAIIEPHSHQSSVAGVTVVVEFTSTLGLRAALCVARSRQQDGSGQNGRQDDCDPQSTAKLPGHCPLLVSFVCPLLKKCSNADPASRGSLHQEVKGTEVSESRDWAPSLGTLPTWAAGRGGYS